MSSPIWISRTLLFSSSRKCDRNIQNEGPAGIKGFQLKIGKILSVNNVNFDRLKTDIKLLLNGDINIFQLILLLPAVEVFCDVISPVADVTIMDVPERRFENCVCLKKRIICKLRLPKIGQFLPSPKFMVFFITWVDVRVLEVFQEVPKMRMVAYLFLNLITSSPNRENHL